MKFVLVPTAAMLNFGLSGDNPSFASFPGLVQYTSSDVSSSASFTYQSVAIAVAAPAANNAANVTICLVFMLGPRILCRRVTGQHDS
ncbi:MAG: hypothetical protein J6Y19_12095 [Kiritimatiellae bacterium]|nr:hypothetical protein [Kiritimatiellia bacterium]